MDNKMTLAELTICNTVGTMFEIVASRHHFNQVELCRAWLHSEFIDLLYQWIPTVFCQSAYYYWNVFSEELNLKEDISFTMDKDALYWFGYIATYWMYLKGVSPVFICDNYDIKEILDNYDIYHTIDNRLAIEYLRIIE